MKLTENEKEDAIKFPQEGNPLHELDHFEDILGMVEIFIQARAYFPALPSFPFRILLTRYPFSAIM